MLCLKCLSDNLLYVIKVINITDTLNILVKENNHATLLDNPANKTA